MTAPPDRAVGGAALLALATAATVIGIDGTLPAMPAMVAAFGASRTSVQVTLSAFMIGVALGQLVHGPLSDRFGRKPVIVAGLLAAAGATAGSAAASSIEALAALRLLHGMSAASGFIVARAAVRDRHERDAAARAISLVLFFHGLAPLLSPTVGAHLTAAFGWNAMFLFISAWSAAGAAVFWILFRETLERPDPDALRIAPMLRNFAAVSRSRPFWAYTACASAAYGMLFSFLSASSHVIITFFGETETAYGYMFGGCMLGSTTGMLAGARLVARAGADRLLLWGACGATACGLAAAGLAWAGVHHWLAVAGPMLPCMFAFSLIYPQSVAGALQPFPRVAGAASSLTGFAQQLVGAATGIVVAGLTDDGTQAAFAHGILFWALVALAVRTLALRRPAG